MAFVKAKIELVNPTVGTGIKVSLKRTNKTSARMSLILSDAVAKQVDWQDGAKLEVLIGDGEHHGLLRLRKNNSAGEAIVQRRETAKGAWFGVKLGHQPAFVDRSEPTRWCQWEMVEDGWVEIVLPKWADETKPGRREGAVRSLTVGGVTKTLHANPGTTALSARKQTVTAGLMGDPPAGRREMLQKMGEMKG